VAVTAGTARAAITPPIGIPLSGFVGRGVATDVHDDLWATVLVLADDRSPGDTRHALVTLDLIGLYSDELVAALKESVRAATGIPPERVFLSCSHTHYGPVVAETGDMPGGRHPLAAAYRGQLSAVVAGCVRVADAARVAVDVRFGTGEVPLGVNRRKPGPDGSIELAPNPDGHVDAELAVVRFDAAEGRGRGGRVATLISYACHPSSLESSVRSISADFPGIVRDEVERSAGGRALFVQGAAGDIDPPDKRPDWARPQQIGAALGSAAIRLGASAAATPSAPLASRRRRVALARRGAASVTHAEAALAELRALDATPGASGPSTWWRELRVSEGEAVLAALRDGRAPTIDADISALRIGDVALAFVPAELFSELGVAIKGRSPAPVTLVVGYTDGALWYVPPRHAYEEGGYEVVDACRVAPGAGEELVDRVLALLHELF
jgi:neutral ceramidase